MVVFYEDTRPQKNASCKMSYILVKSRLVLCSVVRSNFSVVGLDNAHCVDYVGVVFNSENKTFLFTANVID